MPIHILSRSIGRIAVILILVLYSLADSDALVAGQVRENSPGGFTPDVTTPVTTGVEAFSRRTDRYLDNGILHVLISDNGNVDSIKYLKPSKPGTPKANGIEMVAQSGGRHTSIYYWWNPDYSGDGTSTYFSTVHLDTNIDLGYMRAYNPAVHKVVADVEIHYSLGRGNSALYVYLVFHHPAKYRIYPDCQFVNAHLLWPVAHDGTEFFCEKLYIDHGVKTGLSQNGVQQRRDGLEPNFYDLKNAVNIAPFPKEVYQMTSGVFSRQLTGKYSYNLDQYKLGVWGRASDKNKVGQWVIMGSHEYQNNGVTMCEYVNDGSMLYGFMVSNHYGNKPVNVDHNANWTKIFGPFALYFNRGDSGDACWQDAKNQALAEKQAWPYAWLTNSTIYQPRSQRATVTGRLIIHDALRPGASAAGAWVGLAAPDDGTENAPDNWQFQADGYQYWVQAAADGTFTIPNVQTFSTYGGPARFQLYAFSAGTNRTTGCVGEFSTGPFIFKSGVTNLGTLTWSVPHHGASMAWEIGYPNRTADKFRHGDEYAKPGLYLNFANEFSNPLEYTVGVSDWSKDWNYAQCGYLKDGNWTPWKWRIHFNLTNVPATGAATLTTAFASADHLDDPIFRTEIYVNDEDRMFSSVTPAFDGGNALHRHGIHAKYCVEHLAIPMSRLREGRNTITLVQGGRAAPRWHVMYDYLSLELPGTNGVDVPVSAARPQPAAAPASEPGADPVQRIGSTSMGAGIFSPTSGSSLRE